MQNKPWETVLVWILAIALIGSGAYYFINNGRTETYKYDLKQIAATVDDVEVREADITHTVESMRSDSYGNLMADEEWAVTLVWSDFTPETLRDHVIKNQFAIPIMVLNDAAELGIYPDQVAVDLIIEEQQEYFGKGVEWTNFINAMGFADDLSYRRFLEAQDVISRLMNSMYEDSEPTQEEIDDFLAEYAPQLVGKKSSAVIIVVEDEEAYEEALQQAQRAQSALASGMDFATVSDTYSKAYMDLEPGGDMGWQALTNLPDEYYLALDELSVGEVSGIVESDYYLFIIYCTDEYQIGDEGFDPDAVPDDMREEILDALPEFLETERPNKYYADLLESDRITINPMPSGLPYDVDLKLAGELEIIDDEIGDGPEAAEGDLIRVTYVGTLEDGTVFDATYLNETGYFEFVLGEGEVIKGWDQGLLGMRVGGKRTLIIPAAFGYGASGSGSIPAYASLRFEIELLAVNGDFGPAGDNTDVSDALDLLPDDNGEPLLD